jgi:hypothetical protein
MATGKAQWKEARILIEKETGPISSVTEITGGRNSEISVIVRTDDGATFVKGRRAGHPRAWTQERERLVNPLVRHISASLKWSTVDDDWNLLGFECVPGKHADYAPGSPDLPKVIDTLRQLQDVTFPGSIEVKQAEQRWAAYTETPGPLAGTSLLHTEWTPGNVLISGQARLVDWAWPTRGAAWIDPACLVVWLIASDHTPRSAESWAARVPSWHTAPADALAEFARIQALMWEGIATDSPEEWPANLARAARQWASHREALLPKERTSRVGVRPAVPP